MPQVIFLRNEERQDLNPEPMLFAVNDKLF